MLVFRICDKEELDKIQNSNGPFDFGILGSVFIKDNKTRQVNYNNYNPSSKYLHFFKLREGIEHCRPSKGRYVCTYNIPDEILRQYKGRGIYRELHLIADRLVLEEYAIESNRLNKNFLVRVELLTQTIDYRNRYFRFTDDTYKIIYDTPEAEELISEYKKTELKEMLKNSEENMKLNGLWQDEEYYQDSGKTKRM